MDELTASGKAEPASEPAATSVNTSAYTQLLLDTLSSSFDNHLLDSDLSIHSYNSQIQTLTSMADRFPSLEDFSEGQTEVAEAPTATDDDFLARERAALGEDADQFATAQDHVGENVGGDDDLLGGDEPVEELGQFESSFPSVETQNQNERVAPGGTITGTGSPFPRTGYSNPQEPEDEGDAVREWREKRDAEIARRAQVSAEKKEATVNKAREDIDDFYVSYNNKADKNRSHARTEAEQFLANREDTSAGGTSWERIAKLVDVSGKGSAGGASGSGKERFRELLLDLRKDQEAPGSTGL
ncbi:Clathrin light chain [Penicillium brevicompactum]|uniref:Clathrin light chain n=1 Tax=Penicillium brevicompactum TaxID=5074 RepID=A0A9W9U6P6_PENBR|nr:Clathrin light chain [Penicillium brevicompactum]KAJ5319271.1 Clathrin light chain [Penicillium brevicompactum]KAJ5322850.1 Clathrin light chain [Penicillium brevicompactum]KAJ5353797.1 Clathrin light chain [Penicillium brevicompactum]